jgi:urease accessory protein
MRKPILILSAMLLAPTAAFAHTGHGETASLFAGLQHPVSGLDHVTVMLAVGLLAALKGGRALWLWPLTFVGVMIAGGALGMAQVQLPLVEPAILASVVVLGLLVALAVNLPIWLGALVIGVSALFHGHAHGLEAASHGGLSYMIGFAVTTAALHLAGIGAVLALRSTSLQPLVRLAGAACVLIGTGLALNAI